MKNQIGDQLNKLKGFEWDYKIRSLEAYPFWVWEGRKEVLLSFLKHGPWELNTTGSTFESLTQLVLEMPSRKMKEELLSAPCEVGDSNSILRSVFSMRFQKR